MKKKNSLKPKKATFNFFGEVYQVVRTVPYGRVTTYGAIAKFLGAAGSSRMVGWAMNASHGVSPPVPAHRVINRNGELSGKMHFGGANTMESLLKSEGIKVKENKVLNFEKLFWDPAIGLDLEM